MAKSRKDKRVAAERSGDASPVGGAAAVPDSMSVVPATDGAAGETIALDPAGAPVSPRFGIKAYVLFNLIFAAFCVFQLLLVRMQLGEQKGLYFFFILLIVAFAVVSVFDYLYDRYVDPAPTEQL